MTLITRLVGMILLFGGIAWSMAAGGDANIFIDIPTAIFVATTVVCGLLVCCNPDDVFRAIVHGLSGQPIESPEQFARELRAMRCGHNVAWATAIIGTLIGLVITLQHMDDPSRIGPGMAVGLLCALYGVALAELVFNLLAHALTGANEQHATTALSQDRSGSTRIVGIIVLMMVLFQFAMVLAGASQIQ